MSVTDWASRRWSARQGDSGAFERFLADYTPFLEALEANRTWLQSRIMDLGGNRQDLRVLRQYERGLETWGAHLAAAMQDPALRAEVERRMSECADVEV
ncbi:hypothetical protein MSA03_26720 [Microbacterium saccharophilum]|nr:hypothetical protein MSA03_26720 [Microbacterium saccharophilum]